MSVLEFWYRMKIANTVLEVLASLVFLVGGFVTYTMCEGDNVAQVLAKLSILVSLAYFIALFVWLYFSLRSVEVDAMPREKRTDQDRLTQFFVEKLGIAKMLVATLSLVLLLAAIGYGL